MKKKNTDNDKKFNIVSNIYMFFMNVFLFLPIVAVVRASFSSTKSTTRPVGFSTQWYFKLLEDRDLWAALNDTVVLALCSMILAVIFGTLIAFGMYKYKFKGKNAIDTLFYIPIIIPEIVLGIALMTLFSTLKISSGMNTLIIAHTTFSIPYVVFNVKASIAGFDHSVEEASMDLGANPIQTFFNITLPMIFPGIRSGAFMAFTLSIDDVIISYFTSGPGSVTLPIKVMGMVKKGIPPDVNALATVIMLFVLLMLGLSQLGIKERIKMKRAK